MNFYEFAKKIIGGYPAWAEKQDLETVVEDYKRVIHADWDLEELYRLYVSEWSAPGYPPRPAWFTKFARQVEAPQGAGGRDVFAESLRQMNPGRREALKAAAKWFSGEEWQYYRQTPPVRVTHLLRQYGITEDELNKAMIHDFTRERGERKNVENCV